MGWNGMIDQLAHSLDKGSATNRANGNASGQHTRRASRWLIWGASALVLLWAVNGLWQGVTGLRAPVAPVSSQGSGSGSSSVSSGSPASSGTVATGPRDGSLSREYELGLARELEQVLSHIQGAGAVRVSLSLERGPVYVYGTNTSTDSRTTDEKDASGGIRTVVETTSTRQAVVLRDAGYGERPLITEEQRPTVAGVLVLAEGAGTSRVRLDIVRAIQALFPIAAHKITVLPMGR